MGMFDNIIVDATILPDLTQEERDMLNNRNGWQTKDFDNMMTDVYITEDKEIKFKHSFLNKKFLPYKIQIKKFKWEETPKEERPYPNEPKGSIKSLYGSIRETDINIIDSDYTGEFNFYTFTGTFNDDTSKWYEFIVESENGKIISIKRLIEE